MCGIAGFLTSEPETPGALAADTQAMTDAIAHRGPDDAGIFIDGSDGVALGHRRLAIIDLSSEGHQPMTSASGRYVIVYNGEIYNFRELRAELDAGAEPPRWRGHSDTEVMLAAFDRFGVEGGLARLNGMFALAMWDRQARTLHLARDRMGEKPLYFGRIGKRFGFGSELKALRAMPDFDAAIDPGAVGALLRFNYIPGAQSIYAGIRRLQPGVRAEICLAQGSFDIVEKPYWSARDAALRAVGDPFMGDEGCALAALDDGLRRAVGLRMVADVPIGAFLSGGVDSSLITAVMQHLSSRPVRTFTIGFEDPAFDEAPFARAVAAHLRTDHTEHYVTGAEALAVVPALPTMYDEPFADSSQIPTFLVSRLARQQVTVALSGDAGDELFWGYERYVRGVQLARVASTPAWMRHGAARMLDTVPAGAYDSVFTAMQPALPAALRFAHPAQKFRKLAAGLREDDPRAMYVGLVSHWRNGLPLAEPAVATVDDAFGQAEPSLSLEQWMSLLDQRTYLPDDILTKVDRASMSIALETRVPLLDPQLMSFAWSLPASLKMRRGAGKYLLRKLLTRYVPASLTDRPKRGFAVPLGAWLRGPLRDWAEALLDPARLRNGGILDPAPIRARWEAHLAGTRDAHDDLWSVLVFQAWREAYAA